MKATHQGNKNWEDITFDVLCVKSDSLIAK